MKVKCPHCGKEYILPEKLVKGKKKLKLKCAECREVFVVPIDELEEEREIEEVLREIEEKKEEIRLDTETSPAQEEEALEEPSLEELEKEVEKEEEEKILETIEKLKEEKEKKARRNLITNIVVFVILIFMNLAGFYFIRNPMALSSIGFGLEDIKPILWDCLDGNIFFVKGVVYNKSRLSKRYVKLRVKLYDEKGAVIAEGTGYAGFIFSKEEVKNLSKDFIKANLTVFNPKISDYYRVPRDGKKPFMIPIFSGFEGGKSFKVQIIEAPNI